MMEKPDDVTLEECQEAFALLRWKMNKGNFDMIMTLADKGVWHICEQIFGYLNNETLENCRKVSKLWKESLEKIALIKFLEEFGDREVGPINKKLSTILPGWKNAAQKYGVQASIEDLGKVKDLLKKLARGKGKCISDPVHEAARNGYVKLMEFILRTSFDMNTKDDDGWTAWHWACYYGQTETAQLIIQNSKEFDIELNAKDDEGSTALHWACKNGRKEMVQMILKNWKEFGIDIKAQDNDGETALDLINEKDGEEYDQIKKMLEKEYSQIDVTEPVQKKFKC